MFFIVLAFSPAYALDWHAVAIDPATLTDVCVPEVPEVCPEQAFGQGSCAAVHFDNGTWQAYNQSCWNAEPFNVESPYATIDFIGTMFGNSGSDGTEMACGVLSTDGAISCWGSGGVSLGIPTGGEPYTAPAMGNTGRFAALDHNGKIVVWGNISGSFGTPPTTTGFTALSVGRDDACAVGIVNGGVTCWGNGAEHLSTAASRPTTGTYTSVDVARYVAFAVKSDGTTVGWGTDRSASGMVTKAAQFVANRPTTGVKMIDTTQNGELFGVAFRTDSTLYEWIDSTIGTPAEITAAPGFATYGGGGSPRYYIPQGPGGYLTFVDVQIAEYATAHVVSAVVADPKGTMDGARALAPNDAIEWSVDWSPFHFIKGCYLPS